MYALTNYASYEAISSLLLSGDTLPSTLMLKMLALLSSGHKACFFLTGAFLKGIPADVRSHLVHDRTMDPLSLALPTDEIYQSWVFSASALNNVSSTPKECPVLTISAPHASLSRAQQSPTLGLPHCLPSAPSSASRHSDSPMCWCHKNHADQAQKCRALCFWSGNSLPGRWMLFPLLPVLLVLLWST